MGMMPEALQPKHEIMTTAATAAAPIDPAKAPTARSRNAHNSLHLIKRQGHEIGDIYRDIEKDQKQDAENQSTRQIAIRVFDLSRRETQIIPTCIGP